MKNTNIEGGLLKKGGLGQFADLRGTWQEREDGVFEEGVDTPMHTLGGDYEPQICHVEVPMLQLGPFSYWFSLVLVTYGA